VDNGQAILLWIHAQVSPNLLEDLFGPGQSRPCRASWIVTDLDPRTVDKYCSRLRTCAFRCVSSTGRGVYIVDNGQAILLWIHAQVSPNLLEDLFGPGHNSIHLPAACCARG
jgi:hypothetical protein